LNSEVNTFSTLPTVEGVSPQGSLQEALMDAVGRAKKLVEPESGSTPKDRPSDRLISHVEAIRVTSGGIASGGKFDQSEVRVTIRYGLG
jgi:hypothetical protein